MSVASLVSIVVDNYNYGRYLRAAIDSALEQTYRPVEVIVVDDGSTDDSAEVIRAYADRVRPVFKANGGQASAINEGFTHCRGQVVIFLDADDVLLPETAARVAEVFEARPATAKVQYRMRVVDGQGRASGALLPAPRIPLQSGDLRRQEVSFPFDLPWAAMSANAYSARALREILPIPLERYRSAGADWYLAHVAALLGEVCALDEVGALYRIHGANQYGRAAVALDLGQIHKSIVYAAAARTDLERVADRLGLARPRTILSVSDVACRLASLKLCPAEHPLPGDTVLGLLALGLRAAGRRFDVRWPMRALFAVWFVGLALAPRSVSHRLATAFFVPEKRPRLNRWLGSLHRGAA